MSSITPADTDAGAIFGACAEYIEYIDGYADYKNGVVCHAVETSSSDQSALVAYGNYVFLIPKASWVSGGASLPSVTVKDSFDMALVDEKYDLYYDPYV